MMFSMTASDDAIDVGTGWGRRPGQPLLELAQVGPGTPAGELMRRYWQPVALAKDATQTPKRVRVLGEDLVLFRDRQGRPGLLLERCAHRGASLYYGGVEDEGIRCCYHGWLFDTQGRCLEQPCEPEGGLHRDRVRQPYYPLREYHGLLFAYMGPPDRKPAFPLYDVLEDCGPDEMVIADDSGLGSGGPALCDFNWLQHWENVMDPFHVPILHARFSGTQFVEEMAVIPEVTFSYRDYGVRSHQIRRLDDGRALVRITEVVFPNVRLVPSPKLTRTGPVHLITWVVPRDDTSFLNYTLAKVRDPDEIRKNRSTFGGKHWAELTEEEHQRMPGDYEAQRSQGRIALHSDDILTTTDQGITMLRRMLAKQIRIVADGGDPVGVVRGQRETTFEVKAGQYLVDDPETVAVS